MFPKLYLACAFALIVRCFETADAVSKAKLQARTTESERRFSLVKSLVGVPAFMLQLYNITANEDGTIKTKDPVIPRTLRGYLTTGPISKGVLVFNVTNAPVNEVVWKATINLYKKTTLKTITYPLRKRVTVATLDLATGKRVLSQTVSSEGEGWVTFDVTALVTRWLRQPQSNQGVRIQIESKNKSWPRSVTFEYDWQNIALGPLLVLYTDNISNSETTQPGRQSRSVSSRTCSRRDMIVKFSDIKWRNVLGPIDFNAHHCSGDCVYPLGTSSNPTNHAIIQALVSLHNSSIESPCCVPTKLGALSVMYFDNQIFILRTFSGMTVKECGCN